jgi:CubicO group peptidase (beta-lactamase class C family)
MRAMMYPPNHPAPWPAPDAAGAGFGPTRLAEATAYAAQHETAWARDLVAHITAANTAAGEGEYAAPRGPVRPRGPCSGVVLRDGKLAATWGTPDRADTTFSVAKSYMATLVGFAIADGLIGGLDEPIRVTVDDGGFDPPDNHAITWRHMLTMSSEWRGSLWGIPDSIDWNRVVGRDASAWPMKGSPREIFKPGVYYEYNDVRVNRLALALLRVFRRPLPEVLRHRVMDPIGTTRAWEWHGYDQAWVTIDGQRMASVTGGSHWGGGMMISAFDQARFGLLHLNDGVWNGTRILPEGWVREVSTPSAVEPGYGLLWWLNTGRKWQPSVPENCFWATGDGGNLVWVAPDARVVVVTRWLDRAHQDTFLARVLAACV